MPEASEGIPAEPERKGRGLYWIVLAGGFCVLALALIIIFVFSTQPGSASAEIAPHVDNAAAKLLQLDPIDGKPLIPHGFSLADQNGKPMTLSEFRGKSVVLTFNDDKCEDLCTLLAQDVAAANRDLGAAKKKVAFVSINANPYYPQVSAVKSWTDGHGLGSAKNWFFGTGTPNQLSSLWHAYGVPVALDAADRTVEHGTQIFFIGPNGHEKAMGEFGTASANTALFAHVMAQAAVDMLPAGQRSSVGGPSDPAPVHGGTQIGAKPAPIALPELGSTKKLSTTAFHGKYTVVNFWASTCTACVREMPALEKVYRQIGSKTAFLGVDVSDDSGAAAAFAKRVGVSYPLVTDANGTAAGRYRISGLPYTVVLGPKGKVVVRHPGALTTEQLAYILQTLEANPSQ